jgi:hypothetical protein
MHAILNHIRRSTSTAKGNVISAGLYLVGVFIFIVLLETTALQLPWHSSACSWLGFIVPSHFRKV